MPKAGKTHKSTAKRIKVTKKNKFFHSKSWKNHLLTNKGKTRTQRNKAGREVASCEYAKIKKLIPAKLRA